MINKLDEIKSILSNINESDLRMEPYPHIVIENVLSDSLLDTLMSSFPSIEIVTKGKEKGSNKRFDFTIDDLRKDNDLDQTWRKFIESQADRQFIDDFVRIFRKGIEKYYPHLFQKYGNNLENIRLGTRYIDTYENVDLLADAHISLNSPVIDKPTSVRAAHVDDPLKLYGGLFYLRLDNDDSTGGNLLIQKYKDKQNAKFFGQGIDDKYVDVVTTVPYKKNTLVFFLNTIDSLHGVTPRSVTTHQRQFVNFVAEMHEPLFDIQSKQENMWIRRIKTYKNMLAVKLTGGKSKRA